MNNSVDGFLNSSGGNTESALNVKVIVLTIIFLPYILYIIWCLFLVSILPNPDGKYESLIDIGVMTSSIVSGIILLLGGFILLRIQKSDASQYSKVISLGKLFGVLLPGLAISALVVIQIPKEPSLSLIVIHPESTKNLRAPLSVTFSAEKAAEILAKRNLSIVKIKWDFENDGKINDETIEPKVTARFDKKGAYVIQAVLELNDKSKRFLYKQLLIPESVFSVIPYEPIIFEPVMFSISHLLSEGVMLQEAKWDFNGDGELDEVTSEAEIDHTFTKLGTHSVSATIILTNQTQISMEREIEIREPSPLPFDVEMVTQPENLIGPAPFGVLFTIETNEPVEKIEWNLGEGNEASGDRVGHTFRKKGNYFVAADVYSENGEVAKLRKTVRVVDVLRISDLEFDGSPKVQGRILKSEVPVNVDITPRTNQPLIDFYWEAPSASSVESNETTLKATYKKAGVYTITLVGTDPSGSVLRMPLTLEVLPPSSLVSIIMNPSEGVAPLSVRFDASETVIPGEDITGFEWRFGDGLLEPIHGGAQIEYLFDSPGTYKVSVNALTTSGKTFNAEKTIVVRAPVLNACFTASRTTGKAPLGVSFNMSCTTGTPKDIQWDFGDGVRSIERSPIHVFERPGSYSVFLRLQDEQGTTSQEILTITANP